MSSDEEDADVDDQDDDVEGGEGDAVEGVQADPQSQPLLTRDSNHGRIDSERTALGRPFNTAEPTP